jgi:hypothetical protein
LVVVVSLAVASYPPVPTTLPFASRTLTCQYFPGATAPVSWITSAVSVVPLSVPELAAPTVKVAVELLTPTLLPTSSAV